MRQFIIKCVVVAISLLVALVLAEGVLRIAPSLIGLAVLERFHPDLRSKIAKEIGLETDDDFIVVPSVERSDKGPDFYLMKPNGIYRKPADDVDKDYGAVEEVTTDERGFCNPARLAGIKTPDVVTLAGSIPTCTFLSGEEIFSSYLGTKLALASYNLAVRGVGPYEYVEVLKRYVGELNPRLVILAISEGNDLRDCQRYIDHVPGKKLKDRQPLGGPFAWSNALAFIKGGIEVAVATVKDQFQPDFRYTVVARGRSIPMNATNSDIDELKVARAVKTGKISPELYRPPLEEFVRIAHERRFIPLVIIVPNAYTIYDRSITYSDPSVAPIIRNYSATQRNWLAKNAASIGYHFFDPTDALQELAANRPLFYFPSNRHPTAEGQKALAEIVAPTVKALLAAP